MRNREQFVARGLAVASLTVALAWSAFMPLGAGIVAGAAQSSAAPQASHSVTYVGPVVVIKPATTCPGGGAEC